MIAARVKASHKRTRLDLMAELQSSPPEICRFGLRAKAWCRECQAAVLALPDDHFVARAFPEQRTPSILALLRSVS